MWVLGHVSTEYIGIKCIYNYSQVVKQQRHSCILNCQFQERDSEACTLEFEDDIQYLRSLDPKDWKVFQILILHIVLQIDINILHILIYCITYILLI